jgi:hypothetical protein
VGYLDTSNAEDDVSERVCARVCVGVCEYM